MSLLEKFYENNPTNNSRSQNLVFEIMRDLTDLRGLRQEWDNIDPDIKEEIIERWVTIAYSYF